MDALKAPLSACLADGMQECKVTIRGIPAQVLSHRASPNGTSTMPTKPKAVFPAPVVLDMAHGGRPLGTSAVGHNDQSCAAPAPDDSACLAAPLAERGSDQMQSETSTAGGGMCVLTIVCNCVRLALRRQRSAAPRRADGYVQGAAAVGDDHFEQ